MSDSAIQVENLGKLYRLGQLGGYGNFREGLTNAVSAPFRMLRHKGNGEVAARQAQAEFWALRGVSFEVKRGEAIGIIGRNGAGKTTLLRILTRITDPSEGRSVLHGRVSSLLEVGTGFHPELTGRENVFLNGAVLGMKKKEIQRKFDEIIDFSGVEKFLDTPLKRYSSGMQVRLAFSVAAHLEPEILLVDEVLAVGDAEFQKKCLGKMQNVAEQGRTVLFVSHNMSAVARLCPRAVLLDKGRLLGDGAAREVISAYLTDASGDEGVRKWSRDEAPGTEELKLTFVRLLGKESTSASTVEVHEPLKLCIGYYVSQPNLRFRCAALFFTQGVCAFTSIEPAEETREATGYYCSTLNIPPNLLTEGEYAVGISIFTSMGIKHHYVQINDVLTFHVFDSITGSSARGDYAQNLAGIVRPLMQWRLSFEGTDDRSIW